MNFFAKSASFLLVIITVLAVSGGIYFRGTGWAFELSQIDVFAGLLLLSMIGLSLTQKPVSFLDWQPNSFSERLVRFLDRPTEKWLVRGLIFVFGFLFLGHWMRHATFETHIFDMNCLHQPLFYPFEETLFWCNTCRMNTQFAEHMVWTLIPLSLITMFIKSDVLIFLVQSLSVAVPIWVFITRGPLRDYKLHGFWFFVLLMLMKPLRDGMIFDFREDSFGFGLLMLAFTAFYNARWIWGVVLTVLVMLTKENFPVVTLVMGVVLLLERHLPLSKKARWISGLSIIALSLGVFMLYNKVLIPYFMGPSEAKNNILRYMPGMGSTMTEFVWNVLTNPFLFFSKFGGRFFTMDGVRYMAMTLLPFIFWGWRAWLWSLPGLMMAMLNVMSTSGNQASGSFHYDFIVIPFTMMAVALGIRQVAQQKSFSQMRVMWMWSLVLAACVASRGPVYEFTDRVIYLWDRVPAHITVKNWDMPSPLAANQFILTQFNRVKELRWFRAPGGAVPADSDEIIRAIVAANGHIPIVDQSRDIIDATNYALNPNEPWEKAMIDELLKIGGTVKDTAKTARGVDYVVWVQVPVPALQVWCREKQICAEGQR